ncbi:HXXEE domain-containing protein [Intestinibacter sp.]|uniref:HXXEE domain-containing protein n=1 Tax=Intestinibacter sp. TaxID=1965304 RepID=UPI003F145C3A
MEFLQNLWLYLAFAMVGAVGFYLYANRANISKYTLIHGILLMCFVFHMFEERIYPAGFHYIFEVFTGGQQTQFNVMLMNCTVLVILAFNFIKHKDRSWAVGLLSFFGVVEFVLHTIIALKSYVLFHDAGLAVPYAPGWFTCIFMFLPLCTL